MSPATEVPLPQWTAHEVDRGGGASATERVTLDYEGHFLRRRLLATDSGGQLLVDLAETISLEAGDALVATDGTRIAVAAAPEPLIEIVASSHELARLAWHIGNRHTPARIEPHRILIRADRVMEAMLARLGAATRTVREPFSPEGGAYGVGRTHGHAHPEDTSASSARAEA